MASKGECQSCKKPCTTNYVMVKEKPLHAECFACTECKEGLAGKPFIQAAQDNKFYCQDHYWEKYNPKCGHCEETIKGQYIAAMGKHWHEDHFVCSECSAPFTGSQFHRHNDRPYCREHYLHVASPHCNKCLKPVVGDIFEALDQKFHLDCFACNEGHAIGEGAEFHVVDQKIWCKEHFANQFLLTCTECNKSLEGEYIKLGEVLVHPGCWKCSACSVGINPSTAKQNMGIFYCGSCFQGIESKQTKAAHDAIDSLTPAAAKLHLGGGGGGGGGAGGVGGGVGGGGGGGGAGGPGSAAFGDGSAFVGAGGPSKGGSGSDEKGRVADIKIEVFYTYDILCQRNNLPPLVAANLTRKEQFLSDSDFRKIFGLEKNAFYAWPKWKQVANKKKANLF